MRGNTRTCQIYHSARCIGTVDRSLPTLFNFPCSVRINKRWTRAQRKEGENGPTTLAFLLNYRAEVARDERVCAAPPRYTFFTRDCISSLQQVYIYIYTYTCTVDSYISLVESAFSRVNDHSIERKERKTRRKKRNRFSFRASVVCSFALRSFLFFRN